MPVSTSDSKRSRRGEAPSISSGRNASSCILTAENTCAVSSCNSRDRRRRSSSCCRTMRVESCSSAVVRVASWRSSADCSSAAPTCWPSASRKSSSSAVNGLRTSPAITNAPTSRVPVPTGSAAMNGCRPSAATTCGRREIRIRVSASSTAWSGRALSHDAQEPAPRTNRPRVPGGAVAAGAVSTSPTAIGASSRHAVSTPSNIAVAAASSAPSASNRYIAVPRTPGSASGRDSNASRGSVVRSRRCKSPESADNARTPRPRSSSTNSTSPTPTSSSKEMSR